MSILYEFLNLCQFNYKTYDVIINTIPILKQLLVFYILKCRLYKFSSYETNSLLCFAETHRTVLNQILRQSTTPLADGPFSVLVDHTRILDFDVKRRYFRQELERMDEGMRREDLAVHVRREHVFEDSFRELFRKTADEWKHRFYIVFEGRH